MIFASPGSWYEYDPYTSDLEVPELHATATFWRDVPNGDYAGDAVDVDYTLGGTSIAGVDYVGLESGTVTIPAGEWTIDVPFTIINDTDEEWSYVYDAVTDDYWWVWGTTLTINLVDSYSHGDRPKTYELDPPSNGRQYGEIADADQYLVPPETVPTCSCSSEQPVRDSDGAALISSTDLMSDAGGTPWGVTREWTNKANPANSEDYSQGNAFGLGTMVNQKPYVAWRVKPIGDETPAELAEKLAVVMDGYTAYYFDDLDEDGVYQPHSPFNQNTLVKDGDDFVFTDTNGAQYRFSGLLPTIPTRQRGQLQSYTDAGGNAVTLNYDSEKKTLTSAQRTIGSGSTAVTESLAYSYYDQFSYDGVNQVWVPEPNYGQVKRITLQRKAGTGSWQTARKAEYDYYDHDASHGSQWDLRMVTIKEPREGMSDAVIDTMYYRYYTEDDILDEEENVLGYTHGLKYQFSAASYARLVADLGSSVDSLTDAQVAPYADQYFQYNEDRQVTFEVAAGAGSSTATTQTGQGTYQYSYSTSSNPEGYNSWATKFVETLPDNNPSASIVSENIVYSNYMGEVMLKVYHHSDATDGDQKWLAYTRYDDAGRVVLTADSPAVTGYDEGYAALLDDDEEATNWEYLDDDSGLVTLTRYYSDDTDTEFPGQPHGYVEGTAVREGELGDDVPQSHTEYVGQTAGDVTVYLLSLSTEYVNDDGTGELTTTYDYTFLSGTVQVASQTVTDPADGEVTTVNDLYGRPIWTKDAAGFLSYTEYDKGTGAVVKTIADVDTGETGDFADLPTGWTTPTGGGAHLITLYEVDSQGRTTKTTVVNQPHDNVTYTVYLDATHETRVYPGWDSTTHTTTGPTIVTRDDREHGYTETLTMAATPHLDANDLPDGGEDIEDIRSLSRTYFNRAGQMVRRDDYFKVDSSNLTYSTDKYIGGSNTTYYTTTYDYDERGREIRTVRALDSSTAQTVSRTIYDSQGRTVSEWIGEDDTVTGDWSPTNAGDMFKLRVSEYDGGGIGPGNLTSLTETVDHTASPAVTRTTTYEYDFRNRLTTKMLPDPDGAGSEVSPVYVTRYDNLGRVTKQSDGTGEISTLGHYTAYDYDDENLTTTVTRPDADGSSGTTDDVPTTVTVTDARGLVSTQTDALGHVTTYEYDGTGRQIKIFPPDPTTGLKNSGLYTQYEYYALGNITSMTDPNGNVTTYEYDLAGRLTVMTQPDPDGGGSLGAPTVGYGYDDAGNRYTLTDPNNNTTYWEYDPLGHVTSETNYLNAARNLEYDAAGRLMGRRQFCR